MRQAPRHVDFGGICDDLTAGLKATSASDKLFTNLMEKHLLKESATESLNTKHKRKYDAYTDTISKLQNEKREAMALQDDTNEIDDSLKKICHMHKKLEDEMDLEN